MANRRTESAALDRGEWHGVPGQLNGLVLDIDSHVTNYGRHNRLVGPFWDSTGAVFIREDVRGLPMSTEEDRRRLLARERMGRLIHVSSEAYVTDTGESVEHEYRRANRVTS